MSDLTEAISWTSPHVTLSLFVVFLGEGRSDFAWPEGDSLPPVVKTYHLEAPDGYILGGNCTEYDLCFIEIPNNLAFVLSAWLSAAVDAGADVCWFGFEGSFHFDHLLTADIAMMVYAVASKRGTNLAIEDETRLSEAWANLLFDVKSLVGV